MSERRYCKYRKCGGPIPVTARADAEFCRPEHKSAHHNEECRSQAGTTKRLDPASGGVGSRGGNVRSIQEARELQEQQTEKARWTLIVREHMARTLLETGYFHADDLFDLGVPPEHDAIKGSQTAAFVCRGHMVKAGERKCSHKAANGRKAKIYRITTKGRAKLVGTTAGALPPAQGASSRSGETPNTARGSGAGVPSSQELKGKDTALDCASTASPDPLAGAGSVPNRHSAGPERDSSPVVSTPRPGETEPLKLVPDEVGAAPPLSAQCDPEAA